MAKRTWEDVGNKATEVGKGFLDASKSTWEGIKNLTLGAGGTANSALGGIAGKANGLVKFTTNAGLAILQKGFDIVKANPRLAGGAVLTAVGVGIYKFFQKKKVTNLQDAEIESLQQRAAIANIAARQAAASDFDNDVATGNAARVLRQQQMAAAPGRA